jgi:hypothetical protein
MVGEIIMGLKLETDLGMEFEICTKNDIVAAMRENLRNTDEVIMEGNNIMTDASGNITNQGFIYSVPVGKTLFVERLIIWADGKTPASVVSTGWWVLMQGAQFNPGNVKDFAPRPGGTQSIPYIEADGHSHCPKFESGQDMYLYAQGLVASTNISVNFQGTLKPVSIKHGNNGNGKPPHKIL